MFAFGRTIGEVKSACDPSEDIDVVRAEVIVTCLCEQDPEKRMCASEAVLHAFFAPAKESRKTQTAECTLYIHDGCPRGRVNMSMGVTCSTSQHFLCASCLETLVAKAMEPGGDHNTANHSRLADGRIHCPHCMSQQPQVLCDYTDSQLGRTLPARLFDSYLHVRMKLLEDRKMCELEADMQQRLAQVCYVDKIACAAPEWSHTKPSWCPYMHVCVRGISAYKHGLHTNRLVCTSEWPHRGQYKIMSLPHNLNVGSKAYHSKLQESQ
jgi:hypothetical protein